MSANPHNASLGLSDGGSPGNRLPDNGLTDSGSIGESVANSSPAGSRPATSSVSYAPGHEALQALLAFSSLHEQIRQRRAREKSGEPLGADVWQLEQFVLDEVLQLVSERALTLTGADGVAVAMAEGDAIVCRAAAGTVVPESGARLDPKSGFSGACLRSGGIVRCDDTEHDLRVNVEVCRGLGTRSIVAVPIASVHGTIGLLEAFSAEPYGFNDSDVRSLKLLAELILAAMKPEEENRLVEISQRLVAEAVETTSHSSKPEDSTVPAEALGASAPAGVAEPRPQIFQEYGKKQKLSTGVAVLLLALVLALALGAGVWWKFRHASVSEPQTPPPASTALEAQPEPAPPVPEDEPSSGADEKHSAPTLVTGIFHVSSADSSSVIIDMQGEVQYEAHRLGSPERIYIDLHNTSLAPGMFGKTIEIGDARLARVRIAQPRRGISRVVLETTGSSDFSVSLQSNPYRLVVEIRKRGALDHGVPDLPKTDIKPQAALLPTAPARSENKLEGQLRTRVPKFRLVLDAGHGGWDLGTVGRQGLMEKDVVLDIVRRLGKLIENRLGAEVIYTRQDDNYLPLEKRTEIANLAQADLFVSVHANSSDDSSARGSETYYTNTYSSVRARTSDADTEGAAAENVNWNNVDLRDKVQKSRRFAAAVQQALYHALAMQIPRNRGVKKASYVVLTGTSMPAILAEVSFVSSPADEAKLKSSSYRQRIAEGLYRGIAQYASTSHGVNVASAASKPSGL